MSNRPHLTGGDEKIEIIRIEATENIFSTLHSKSKKEMDIVWTVIILNKICKSIIYSLH